MHGLINRSIQVFLTETYGERAWLAVARGSGAEIADFESMQSYDDAVTGMILAAAERVLQKPRARILEDIGTWLIAKRQPDTVRRLLRFGGVDFVEFLYSLDDLPGRVRLAVNDLDLPAMELEEHAPFTYTLTLRGGPPGFGQVLQGLLQAMADDYGALAVIEQTAARPGLEVLRIQLFQTDYALGRGFQLQAPAS
ncbi:heme NO-binding domain-containing protein [Frigidibacter sp. ROC022]|uniref:heme NO-binding domain-containing protein n=1 Tax=Frigidibacter sp. ROC022 TaxID=2971796 RepID=UPI00215AE8F7|nr:heme NO-binding domain-containing protein [Frigidibacter sp. ROC022]MCR8725064.1 heme NO-binding domain-containing protein [Frigidibacter sp. ROC022]